MYPVCIRMMYNAAMDEFNDEEKNIIRIKRNPFKKIVIPKADVPEKRAVSVEVLQRFFNAPVPESKMKESLSELGRDVAEMVFGLAGMNTADLFELRKENLKDGTLCYHRQKTKKFRRDGAYLEVKIPKRLLSLFEKYRSDNDCPPRFTRTASAFTAPRAWTTSRSSARQMVYQTFVSIHSGTHGLQ